MTTSINTPKPDDNRASEPTVTLAVQLQTAHAFGDSRTPLVSDELIPARTIVEDTVGAVIYGPALRESFSDLIPKRLGRAEADNLIPIDELLGTYSSAEQKITIYQKSIAQHSRSLSCKPHQLEALVRLHEYAHAVVHLGVTSAEESRLRMFSGTETDWQAIREERDCFFKTLNERAHEFLAQAITWNCLWHTSLLKRDLDDLPSLFVALASRQRAVYDISSDLRNGLDKSRGRGFRHWSTILGALRDRNSCDLNPHMDVATAVEKTICVWYPTTQETTHQVVDE